MRILVVDDGLENLAAAQKGTVAVPGVELIICSTAKLALSIIDKGEVSLVISDMMFFEEIEEGRVISSIYKKEIKKMYNFWQKNAGRMAFCKVGHVGQHATFQEEIYRLKYGKISPAFLQYAEGVQKNWAISQGYYEADYGNIPKQFALGLVVVSYALSKGVEAIIATDGHRHGWYLQMGGIVQVPFIMERPSAFITVDMCDGEVFFEPQGYTGALPDDFSQYMQDADKKNQEFWRRLFLAALAAKKPFKTN